MTFRPFHASLTTLLALIPSTLVAADDGIDVYTLEPATLVPMTGGNFELVGTVGAMARSVPLAGNGFTLESGYWGLVTNYSYLFTLPPGSQSGDFFNPASWSVAGAPSTWLPSESDIIDFGSLPLPQRTINMIAATPTCVAVGGLSLTGGSVTFSMAKSTLQLDGIEEPSTASLTILGSGQSSAEVIVQTAPNQPGPNQLVTQTAHVDSTNAAVTGSLKIAGSDVSMLNLGDVTVGDARRGSLTIEDGADVTSFADVWLGVGPLSLADCRLRNAGSTWRVEGDFFEVAASGNATVSVKTGASLELATALVSLGTEAGSTGMITVDDPGSQLAIESGSPPQGNALVIGGAGTGELACRDGGTLLSGQMTDLVLGQQLNATGRLTVIDGSSASFTSPRLVVGDAGLGEITVDGNSQLITSISGTNPSVVLGSDAGGLGTATIAGGSLWSVVGSELNVGSLGTGEVHLNNGLLDAAIVRIAPTGLVEGTGTIDGDVRNAGLFKPAAGASIQVTGNFSQVSLGSTLEPAGQIVVETFTGLGGVASIQCDGDVDLDGGLTILNTSPTPPSERTPLTVVSGAQSVNATFDVVFVDGIPDLQASVLYPTSDSQGGDAVVVTFEPLPGSAGFGDAVSGTIDFVPSDAAFGDIDGNGQPDLMLAYPASSTGGSVGLIQVIPNLQPSGGEVVSDRPIPFSGGVQLSAIAAGDVNGDGLDDVLAVNSMLAGGLIVLTSNGTSLVPWTGTPFPALTLPTAVATRDLNDDGIDDILVSAGGPSVESAVYVFTSTGVPGSFTSTIISFPPETLPCFFATADIDGDGDPDGSEDVDFVVALSGTNQVAVFLNDGNGNFGTAAATTIAVGTKPMKVALRNVDGIDVIGEPPRVAGMPDIVTIDELSGTISVVLNESVPPATQGGAAALLFSNAVSLPVSADRGVVTKPRSIALIDKDEDQDLDIVVALQTGTTFSTRTLRNDFTGAGASFNAGDEDPNSAGTRLVLADDLDGDLVNDLLAVTSGSGLQDLLVPNAAMNIAPNAVRRKILGDLDGNGLVDAADLAILLGAWGLSDPAADLDGSGAVDAADLAIVLGAWSVA